MPLDEFIEYFNNISIDMVDELGLTVTDIQQLVRYLEELNICKSALEFQQLSNSNRYFEIKALKKDLELYKKALKSACKRLSALLYHHPENHIEEIMNVHLQEASKE